MYFTSHPFQRIQQALLTLLEERKYRDLLVISLLPYYLSRLSSVYFAVFLFHPYSLRSPTLYLMLLCNSESLLLQHIFHLLRSLIKLDAAQDQHAQDDCAYTNVCVFVLYTPFLSDAYHSLLLPAITFLSNAYHSLLLGAITSFARKFIFSRPFSFIM